MAVSLKRANQPLILAENWKGGWESQQSVLTYFSFVVKNLKNVGSANWSAHWKQHCFS